MLRVVFYLLLYNYYNFLPVLCSLFLKADKNELLTLWLADKVQYVINEELSFAEEALEIVKRNIKDDTKTHID